jgi:hypothetical protein
MFNPKNWEVKNRVKKPPRLGRRRNHPKNGSKDGRTKTNGRIMEERNLEGRKWMERRERMDEENG